MVTAEGRVRMTLANDVRALRDRILADLNAAYDYYTETTIAWEVVRQVIATGNMFSIRNLTTSTVTTPTELVSKANEYVSDELAAATFQQFISIFENL